MYQSFALNGEKKKRKVVNLIHGNFIIRMYVIDLILASDDLIVFRSNGSTY